MKPPPRPPLHRPATPTQAFAPPRPRERVRTDPMIDRALVAHEASRPAPDPATAARILEEHEARRRSSIVDTLEKELTTQQGAFTGFTRHVLDELRAQREGRTATDAAIVVLARHLGIEDRLPPQVRNSNRPPPMPLVGPNGEPLPPPKPEPPKLDAIKNDAKAGTQATLRNAHHDRAAVRDRADSPHQGRSLTVMSKQAATILANGIIAAVVIVLICFDKCSLEQGVAIIGSLAVPSVLPGLLGKLKKSDKGEDSKRPQGPSALLLVAGLGFAAPSTSCTPPAVPERAAHPALLL